MCKQKTWNKSLHLTYLILARSKRSQKKQLPCCKSPAGFGETENFRKSLEWCTKQHLITCSSNQTVNKWASFWHDRNTSILGQGNVQDLLSDKTLVMKASCSSARLAIFPACFVIISFVWRTTCIHPSTNNAKPKNCIICSTGACSSTQFQAVKNESAKLVSSNGKSTQVLGINWLFFFFFKEFIRI